MAYLRVLAYAMSGVKLIINSTINAELFSSKGRLLSRG